MNKKLLAGGVIAVLLAGWLGAWLQPDPQAVPSPAPELGALSGPEIPYDYLRVNGVARASRSRSFGTATTTPCVLQAPSSTSTLVFASLKIDTASSTATTWNVGKDVANTLTADGVYATTTKIAGPFSLASGAQGTMVASTTPVNGGVVPVVDSNVVFGPNEYLVWAVTGLTYSGFDSTKLAGTCMAEFIVN